MCLTAKLVYNGFTVYLKAKKKREYKIREKMPVIKITKKINNLGIK